ncbi:hypothetical protein BDA99DRAFT_492576 [Phascolomyces articulosus]|uniref:Arrestin-like N-terminal domain-containing protein n=1 Tax=Phascolomyces articulosus TaxID=60185 RepID=A0AAD5PKH9_9FUNG|nr:hypothetical protein BDA99DRAFT_492576 [Phascolomyces articulosus]
MSKYRNGDKGVVFSVRARLSPSSPSGSSSSNIWLDPGTIHRFPFFCQMPMVNFPPPFQHSLFECKYTLVATVNDVYKSQPFLIDFEPCVETNPNAKIHTYTYTRDRIRFSLLSGLYYQLHKDTLIRIHIDKLTSSSFSTLIVALKQQIIIGYRQQPDPHVESTILSSVIINGSNSNNQQPSYDKKDGGVLVELPFPNGNDTGVNKLLPTVIGSCRFSVHYKILVSTKIRCGPIVINRKLFEIPITVGTLPHGTSVSPDLRSYADENVLQDMTTCTKPRLSISSVERTTDILPAYDAKRPPIYYPRIPA